MTTSLLKRAGRNDDPSRGQPAIRRVSLSRLRTKPDSADGPRLPDLTWSRDVVWAMQLISPIVVQQQPVESGDALDVVANQHLVRWLRHLLHLEGRTDQEVLVIEMPATSAEVLSATQRLIAPLALGFCSTRDARAIRRELKKLNHPALRPVEPAEDHLLKPVIRARRQ